MEIIKRIVKGSILEPPARVLFTTIQKQLSGKKNTSEWSVRLNRDSLNIDRILDDLLLEDSNSIDIGAYQGSFINKLISRSPNGQIFAFEPLPEMATGLKNKFPQIAVYSCALSDESGRGNFYRADGILAYSGLKKQPYPIGVNPKKIEVDIRRLDAVIPDNIDIDLIKLDVEGAEYKVLLGATETIKRNKPHIIFENARIHADGYGISSEMIFDLLTKEFQLNLYSLDGTGPLSNQDFKKKIEYSYVTNYGRNAETNFLAK
jgi:FkbM family methyltransferase